MIDWLRRLPHSRAARNWTLGAIAMLALGSSGGALLANYTVTGMDPLYIRQTPPQLASRDEDEGLVRDVSLEDWGVEIPRSTTSPDTAGAAYSDASY